MSETNSVPEEKMLPVLQRPEAIVKFTNALMPIYKDSKMAEARVIAEIMEFNRTLNMIKAEDLAQIPQSEIFRVAVSSFATGLSWASEEANFYLKTRNVKVTVPGQPDRWIKKLEHSLSTNGESSLRISQNIILGVSGPYVIYDGDDYGDVDYVNKTLRHKPKTPRDSKAKVVAVYCFADLPHGRKEMAFLQQADFDRLADFSRKENTPKDVAKIVKGKEYANDQYFKYNGGIDPEFACRKALRKVFRPLAKCKTFGVPLSVDQDDTREQMFFDDDDNDFQNANEVHPDTPETNPGSSEAPTVLNEKDEDDF